MAYQSGQLCDRITLHCYGAFKGVHRVNGLILELCVSLFLYVYYFPYFSTHLGDPIPPYSCSVPDRILDAFAGIEFPFFLHSRYNFHPTTASISFLHLFWISIDSKKILYFASSSFFSLSPTAGCTTVAGGVISCM